MKRSLILLVLLAVGLSVCGQSQLAVGVEGGPALTFLRGNKEIKKATDPTASYSTGIFLHFYAAENQYVRTGIQLEKRGAREKDEYSGEVYHYNYNYLDVPFVMRVTTRGKTKLFADLGFFVGYLLRAYITSDQVAADLGFTSHSHRFDAGLVTGAGISLPAWENARFSIEIRNDLGIVNVLKYKDPALYPKSILTNSTAFLFGLEFTINPQKEK